MSSLGTATLVGGVLGGVPMNATSAMTDLNKEGVKGDSVTARYTVAIITLLHLAMWLDLIEFPKHTRQTLFVGQPGNMSSRILCGCHVSGHNWLKGVRVGFTCWLVELSNGLDSMLQP